MSFDGHINKFPNSAKLYKLEDLKNVNAPSLVIGDILVFNGIDFSNVQASSLVNNIYNSNGTLSSNRVLDGDAYAYDLNFSQISFFGTEANEFYHFSNNNGTLETNGNLNLLSNENLAGGVAKNTDLRSIPDWDLTGDLSGRMYSGNDVLDLFGIFGANIRGTGFFNKRTSNNIHHYIFAGDTTGTGGTEDEITLGMSDFGLTGFSTEIGLVRDNGLGQGNFRIDISNPTAYYNFDVTNEGSLSETFANTGYTYQIDANNTQSNTSYLSNNHSYGLLFNDGGGEYAELKNADTVGPENSYLRLFRTNIQNSVSDGILGNSTALSLTGFNIFALPTYSNAVSEKIVIRDNTTGDLKDSISIDLVSKKETEQAVSGNTAVNANEVIIYQGGNLGAPFTHTVTLPNGSSADKIVVKVYSNDVLRVVPSGTDTIDGNAFLDIDGTVASKPSVTFFYSTSVNAWVVI